MATCKECNKSVSCGCVLKQVPNRSYSVCPECLSKLLKELENDKKNGQNSEVRTPNVQGV